jgi:PAS domain S-box-containing protein
MMSSDWYWETDAMHRFTLMSAGQQITAGEPFDTTKVIGHTRWAFGSRVMDEATARLHQDTMNRQLPFRNLEYRRLGARGDVTIRSISGNPLFDAGGRFVGYRGVGRNVTAERLASVALAESELHYRTLVEASPDAVRVICDGRIVMANPASLKLLGVKTLDQIVGRDVIETMHPDCRDQARERMRIVIEERRAVPHAEQRVLRPDGSEVWIDVASMPYTYQGKPAVLSIARDLSEPRAAEAAHREISRQLGAIIDSAMDAIVTVDANLRVVVFNQAAERMFRVSAAQAIGTSIDALIPARFRAAHAHWMRAFAMSGSSSRAMGNLQHVAAQRADGEEFRAEASISHSEVAGRRAYTVIMRDVTATIAAQKQLAEAETRYRSLVENSPGGVAILHDDIIEYANPGLALMLGHSGAADLMGTSILASIAPAFHERVRANLTTLGARSGVTLAGHLHMRHRDGSTIDIDASAASFETGGRILVQSEIRDVTREQRALREVKALNRTLEASVARRTAELTRANRELEAFSYSVAHDLRAPLRSMSGFAQLLEFDVESGVLDELPKHVSRITASADRMGQLIDGLLTVARASHEEFSNQCIDMNALLETVLAEHGARERAAIVVDSLPVVWADTAAMHQVWDNLISNALKYSGRRAAAKIAIKYETGESEVIFSVSDNGAGFDAAHAERLFGVFQRLHAASEFEGTGVGLAIVRQVVERHGGRVWAEGAPDQGATFHFSLPNSRLAPAQGA